MKKALIALTLALAAAACAGVGVADPDPVVSQTMVVLEDEENAAKAELAVARAAGDVEATKAAQVRLEAAEAATANFEAETLKGRAVPFIDAVSSFLGPVGAGLKYAALGLVPLLGRRGRKHFGKAVKNLNPWKGPTEGAQPGVAPIAALMDLSRYIGMNHSTTGSEADFEAQEKAIAMKAATATA